LTEHHQSRSGKKRGKHVHGNAKKGKKARIATKTRKTHYTLCKIKAEAASKGIRVSVGKNPNELSHESQVMGRVEII